MIFTHAELLRHNSADIQSNKGVEKFCSSYPNTPHTKTGTKGRELVFTYQCLAHDMEPKHLVS